ncbi:alpha-1-antiproteinase 2-like isoform X1 [Convolutriloba macropyga]|uniref:alpha-1-antiproteinase 2-like isoform X1 n=1 Tax=Convolutriloba macropyga TaxID=536237 RepID=UPI003F528EC8
MSQQSFTTASNFGHSLTSLYLSSNEGKNSAISPISVFICMYMLKHGANGVTKAELEKALSIEDSNGQEAQDVIKVLTQSSNSQFTLTTANGLFLQVKFDPVAEYVKYLKKNFSAHVQTVAFGTSAGEKIVNDWVEKETNGKIKDLVKGTQKDTVLALINAVYMKGKWQQPFKKSSTRDDNFHVSSTKTVKAPFMHQQSNFLYISKDEENFALAFLPYRAQSADTAWVMGIILPKMGSNPSDFVKFLEFESLKNLYTQSSRTLLNVKLPKVKVEATIDLIPFFQKLGVRAAFGTGADFSGISGNQQTLVSDIRQKCFVDIDEEGTEAAAATVAMMMFGCARPIAQPIDFHVTSPFVYFIYQPDSGIVLFVGTVNNPVVG